MVCAYECWIFVAARHRRQAIAGTFGSFPSVHKPDFRVCVHVCVAIIIRGQCNFLHDMKDKRCNCIVIYGFTNQALVYHSVKNKCVTMTSFTAESTGVDVEGLEYTSKNPQHHREWRTGWSEEVGCAQANTGSLRPPYLSLLSSLVNMSLDEVIVITITIYLIVHRTQYACNDLGETESDTHSVWYTHLWVRCALWCACIYIHTKKYTHAPIACTLFYTFIYMRSLTCIYFHACTKTEKCRRTHISSQELQRLTEGAHEGITWEALSKRDFPGRTPHALKVCGVQILRPLLLARNGWRAV